MKFLAMIVVAAVAQAAPTEDAKDSSSLIDLKKEPIDDLKQEESKIQEAAKIEPPQDLKKDIETGVSNVQGAVGEGPKEEVEKRFLLPGFGGYRGFHGAHGSYANVATVGQYGSFGGFGGGVYGGGLGMPIGPAVGLPVPGAFYG